jgi:hypothetical protein
VPDLLGVLAALDAEHKLAVDHIYDY